MKKEDTITLAMLAMHALIAGRKEWLPPQGVAEEAFEYAKAMQKEAEYRGLIESEKKGKTNE